MTNCHKIAAFLRPIAHRGLHDASAGIIENTAAAFSGAVAKNYAIECDLRPAGDGTPMVFHDAALDRLTDGSGAISLFTAQELRRFNYANAKAAGEKIITFAELLDLVAGRVPLMVEIKNEWQIPDDRFLKEIAALTVGYGGAIALKSFDPDLMRALRLLAPDIPRGIVAGKYSGDGWWRDELGACRRFGLSHLLYSFPARPSFISYNIKDLPALAPGSARKIFKLPLFTWTVRSNKDRAAAAKWADAPIFEGFEP